MKKLCLFIVIYFAAIVLGDDADKKFVQEAASAGMMEVELGKIAQQKAVAESVKEFGRMMERDHSKANEELKSIAAKYNLEIPGKMLDKQQEKVNKFNNIEPAKFDTEYMMEMVKDHKEDIEKFKEASRSSGNEEIRNWAEKNLPVLEQHLNSAKEISGELNMK